MAKPKPQADTELIAPAPGPARRASAETMATRQREISVSEFFTKNRHLLGFDNPAKALLTTIKEAVDNSLDACEEAGILPDITVEIVEVQPGQGSQPGRYRVAVEDNGPGIVKPQIPKIFAKLLYGSKFHRLKQSRGQQGIGISAAGLYAQLTTGKPITILSKTGKGRPAYKIDLRLDTKRNQPDVVSEETVEWMTTNIEGAQEEKVHGTRVELELAATYRGGRTGVDAYLEQTIVANPHLGLIYLPPKAEKIIYPRVSNDLPREAQEIKPHPHGIELGMLLHMLQDSPGKTVKQVLCDDFSQISPSVAEQICKVAKVPSKTKADKVHGDAIDQLHKALGLVKIRNPSASAVVPIGEELLVAGLKRRFNAEFYASTTRPPAVYRGNPFVVEVGLAYGGDIPSDETAEIMRFANRVPLQYQPKACAISESVYDTNWKSYELSQPKGSLPIGPLAIVVHLASVWVPFTSEAKEAVAHYDDLLKEMRLAIQECGRKLGSHLRARAKADSEFKRFSIFQRYIPEVAAALGNILGKEKDGIAAIFKKALPNFVNIAEAQNQSQPPPPPDGEDGAPAAAAAVDQKSPAKKAKRKGNAAPVEAKAPVKKGKKKPEQLSL